MSKSISTEQILDDEDASPKLKEAARKEFEIRKEDEIIVVEVDSFSVVETVEI